MCTHYFTCYYGRPWNALKYKTFYFKYSPRIYSLYGVFSDHCAYANLKLINSNAMQGWAVCQSTYNSNYLYQVSRNECIIYFTLIAHVFEFVNWKETKNKAKPNRTILFLNHNPQKIFLRSNVAACSARLRDCIMF